jgi:hypothetical protein
MAAVRVPPSACSTSQSSSDGALAQRLQVEHAAQRAADQALDLLRAPALLAARGLAVAAGVGGARQHAVLGRDPAFAAAALVRRHLLSTEAVHSTLGVAELDQHRALGMAGVAAGDAHGAQRVGGAPGLDGGGEHLVAQRCCRWTHAWLWTRTAFGGFPLDASTVTLSLFSPPCAAPARPVRAPRRRSVWRASCSVMMASSLTLPHRPSEHSSTRSPCCRCTRAGHVDHGLARAAQAGEQHVAVDALGRPWARPGQGFLQLGVGVVARARQQLVAAHHVQARVAAVRPVGAHCPAARRPPAWCAACRSALVAGVAQQSGGGRPAGVVRKRTGGQAGLGLALEHRRPASAARAAPPPRPRGGRPCRRPARTGRTSRV